MDVNQVKNTNRHRWFIIAIAIILIVLEIAG